MPDKPTLEDLLRLKRAEQPSPKDWDEFDCALKRKMVSNFVKRESILKKALRPLLPRSASIGFAAIALIAVFVIPFISISQISESSESESVFHSKASLPAISHSYALGEISAEARLESPVNAMMNGSGDESVRYVSGISPSVSLF